MGETLYISEILLTIQGQGNHVGWPCTLVRLAGCNLNCSWCDTPAARGQGEAMSIEEVMARVQELGCGLVEVTGGEPLLQPASLVLLQRLCDAGCQVLLETSGERDISGVDRRVVRIVDVKCPSSGESGSVRWANLDQLRPSDEVKMIIADRADYEFARAVIGRYDLCRRCTVLMGAVAGRLNSGELADWILQDRLPVRVQVQLHKVLWPGQNR